MRWRWGSESPVFDGVSWLQGLWASRSTVSADSSFVFERVEDVVFTVEFLSGQRLVGIGADVVNSE